MSFTSLLAEKKAAIVEAWRGRLLESYPGVAAGFLARERDPFANPVGATISRELPVLLEAVLGEVDEGQLARSVESLVRIRAVEDLTPSRALAFVFMLKPVIVEALGEALSGAGAVEEWRAIEARVDDLALRAFEAYVGDRERLCQIRVDEMKKRVFVMERASGKFGKDNMTNDSNLSGGGRP